MKSLKTLVYILFAILITNSYAIADADGYFAYSNPYHGVSIKYPSSWKCSSMPIKGFGIEIANSKEALSNSDLFKSVMLTVVYRKQDASIESELENYKMSVTRLEGYKYRGEGYKEINNRKFFWISYIQTDQNREIYVTGFMTTARNKRIVISNGAMTSGMLESAEFTQINQSFEETEGYTDARKQLSDSLNAAAWKGDLPKSKLLIDQGAGVNDLDSQGHCPLSSAATTTNFELFSLLLEKGANPNTIYPPNGNTPIFWVNWNLNNRGKLNFYQLLIDKGADLTVVNHKGKTIYQTLKEQIYLKDDAKFLKSKGAK